MRTWKSPTFWEVSHPNGESIYIRQVLEEDQLEQGDTPLVFGPFLFMTEDQVASTDNTFGPYNLFKSLKGHDVCMAPIPAQKALYQIHSGMDTDIVVVGHILVPLTFEGALMADHSLFVDADGHIPALKETHTPWTDLAIEYGDETLRWMALSLIEQMALTDEGDFSD